MEIEVIKANTLEDAWPLTIYRLVDTGRLYIIDRGSFAGQQRLEFDYVVIQIKNPGRGELIPKIPEIYNMDNPVADGYVEGYCQQYLMGHELAVNESYTYGSRLNRFLIPHPIEYFNNDVNKEIIIQEIDTLLDLGIIEKEVIGDKTNYYLNQIELVIWLYKNKGHRNNQTVLQIAHPSDMLLQDPPCLRQVQVRIQDGKLHFFPYFRCIDATTLMIYKVDNLIHIGPIGEIHLLVAQKKAVYVINTDFVTGKIKWAKVKRSTSRIADNIRRYDFENSLPFGMTDEHIVFDENFKEKNASQLCVSDNLIKLQLLTTLPRQHIKELNFCEMFYSDPDVYLYNWESTKQMKDQFEYSLPEQWDRYRDGKYIPITELESINNIPENVTIGARLGSIKYPVKFKLTFEFGYLVGHYLANGWIKRNNNILISIGKYRQETFDKLCKYVDMCKITYTTYEQDSVNIMHIGSTFLVKFFSKYICKEHATDKFLSPLILNANSSFQTGVLCGFESGDANCSSSIALITGLEYLSKINGYASSIYVNKKKDSIMPAIRDTNREIVSTKDCNRLNIITGIRDGITINIYKNKIKNIGLYYPGEVIDLEIDSDNPNFAIGSSCTIVHNSWDMWNGMPANLGALQIMKMYMAEMIGVEDGEIIANCPGAHVYGYALELAKTLRGKGDIELMIGKN